QYREEAKRVTLQKAYANEDEFLESLGMKCTVKPFDKFNTPRVAQLSQRSNQFNLRTVRYTEQDIERIARDDDYTTFTFSLEDKFGDYGLIGVIILKYRGDTAFIDTWFMSCRVLKREMENFMLNAIVENAKSKGIKQIVGEYIPTPKNELVKDHYKGLGFTEKDGLWYLSTQKYKPFKNHIKIT